MSGDELDFAGGIELPMSTRRPVKWPKRMPENPISRRIVTLVVLHDETLSDLKPMISNPSKLDDMGDEDRAKLLESINSRLNIKPTISRKEGGV